MSSAVGAGAISPSREETGGDGPTSGPPSWGWRGLVVAGALLLVGAGQLVPVYTVDVFTHLAVGDWILDHGRAPDLGIYSATRGQTPWVDCEWGYQLLLAALDRVGGVRALVLFNAALVVAGWWAVAEAGRRRGVGALVTAWGVTIGALAAPPLSARPQNLTILLLGLTLFGEGELRRGRRAWALGLPLIALVWVNGHAGFILGAVVFGVSLVADLGTARLFARSVPELRLRLAVLATCAVAGLANPYGWRQLVYPLTYAVDGKLTEFNQEWQPTVLADHRAYLVLLALAVCAASIARGPRDLRGASLASAFALFSLSAVRHVGVASVVIVYAALPWAEAAARRVVGGVRASPRAAMIRVAMALAVGALACAPGLAGRWPTSPVFALDPRVVLPSEALDFIEREKLPGTIFNQYRWGGYILARCRPRSVAYVDGRNDLYGASFMAEYLHILEGRRGCLELLEERGIDLVLLELSERNWRLLHLLLESGWRCLHASESAGSGVILLARDVSELAPWIDAYARDITLPLPP